MYHPEIIERRLWSVKKRGHTFKRLPREQSIFVAGKIDLLRYAGNGQLLPEGQLTRPLNQFEQDFIRSERILCKADFEYYLSRYHVIERDPGVGTESGIGPAKPLESQKEFVRRLGRREKECYEEMDRTGFTAGILVYAHKCRQVAFTATARGISIHRMVFWPGSRCFAATLKDGAAGTGELYKRDLLAITSLPFWLKPAREQIYPNVKDEEIGFTVPFQSRLSYQAENQTTGIGTGTQQDISHLTEVSLWTYPSRIRYSFVPSIPKSINTVHIQEATSAGKGGYWQEVTEAARKRRRGFEDYIYIFVPWYMNTTKYQANAPDDWKPEEHTVKHAELIERTSPEFCNGSTYRPSRNQLYWWETNRALHAHNNETAAFLANYPATPEQSFTNWAAGALPAELIEELELDERPPGRIYDIVVNI